MPQTIWFEGRSYSFPDDATDAEIAEALDAASEPGSSPASRSSAATPPAFGPLGVAAAGAVRPVAERVGLELATAPVRPAIARAAGSIADNATLAGSLIAGPKGAAIGKGV